MRTVSVSNKQITFNPTSTIIFDTFPAINIKKEEITVYLLRADTYFFLHIIFNEFPPTECESCQVTLSGFYEYVLVMVLNKCNIQIPVCIPTFSSNSTRSGDLNHNTESFYNLLVSFYEISNYISNACQVVGNCIDVMYSNPTFILEKFFFFAYVCNHGSLREEGIESKKTTQLE